MALLLQANGSYSQNGLIEITASDIAGNLIPVIAGNIVGGSVLVALIYWLIYRKNNKCT
jgi:formate/nitrite transporter FocA (FNT family)